MDPSAATVTSPKSGKGARKSQRTDAEEAANDKDRLCMPQCVNCALRGSTCRACKKKGIK